MARFGKELIESLRQAGEHVAGKKVQGMRIKRHRRSFATAELSDEQVQEIDSSRMHERHAHLNSMLKPK
jgi:hypothetical protein